MPPRCDDMEHLLRIRESDYCHNRWISPPASGDGSRSHDHRRTYRNAQLPPPSNGLQQRPDDSPQRHSKSLQRSPEANGKALTPRTNMTEIAIFQQQYDSKPTMLPRA